MKIYSAPDLHKIDQNTIEQEGITSLELMERAASAVVYEIVSRYPRNKDICIFAGPGNNGGDALAGGLQPSNIPLYDSRATQPRLSSQP